MTLLISCRELGMDCDFMAEGDGEAELIVSFMRHVQDEHEEDWFDSEEIYQVACSVIREKAA